MKLLYHSGQKGRLTLAQGIALGTDAGAICALKGQKLSSGGVI